MHGLLRTQWFPSDWVLAVFGKMRTGPFRTILLCNWSQIGRVAGEGQRGEEGQRLCLVLSEGFGVDLKASWGVGLLGFCVVRGQVEGGLLGHLDSNLDGVGVPLALVEEGRKEAAPWVDL
ncbi:hypothetical protein XENOCAPTIV_019473 [Xenoophorus captivus]|uniref:Uncharacterized protein n=1 Tax=Xenoophorus captivus TaxID=1517983 RepID=A0ABV0QJ81_9TELE